MECITTIFVLIIWLINLLMLLLITTQMYFLGPFTNEEMLEWFKAGYFTIGLLVRRVCDEVFLPLGW